MDIPGFPISVEERPARLAPLWRALYAAYFTLAGFRPELMRRCSLGEQLVAALYLPLALACTTVMGSGVAALLLAARISLEAAVSIAILVSLILFVFDCIAGHKLSEARALKLHRPEDPGSMVTLLPLIIGRPAVSVVLTILAGAAVSQTIQAPEILQLLDRDQTEAQTALRQRSAEAVTERLSRVDEASAKADRGWHDTLEAMAALRAEKARRMEQGPIALEAETVGALQRTLDADQAAYQTSLSKAREYEDKRNCERTGGLGKCKAGDENGPNYRYYAGLLKIEQVEQVALDKRIAATRTKLATEQALLTGLGKALDDEFAPRSDRLSKDAETFRQRAADFQTLAAEKRVAFDTDIRTEMKANPIKRAEGYFTLLDAQSRLSASSVVVRKFGTLLNVAIMLLESLGLIVKTIGGRSQYLRLLGREVDTVPGEAAARVPRRTFRE